jgi:hypothetical protein
LPAFIEAIKSEILGHRSIYDQFLEIEEIFKMLDILEITYVDQPTEIQIIDMVLDFLSYCKNCARGGYPLLKSTFTKNYPYELAQRWMKHREEIFNFNKSQLKILSYIVEKPKSGKR